MNPADGEVVEPITEKEPGVEEIKEEKDQAPTALMEDPKELELVVKAFPNPATSFLNLQVKGMVEHSFSYKIIDLTGQLVDQQLDLYGQNKRIDISQLPKGIYIVTVQVGSQQVTNKVIVR